MEMIRKVNITASKSGLPCLDECGGGWTNTGFAQIVADALGRAKRAIHVRIHGELACKDHAIIPVRVGDVVVTVDRHGPAVAITVERIIALDIDNLTATLERTDEKICWAAICAAVDKSHDYHCRRPYYIQQVLDEA